MPERAVQNSAEIRDDRSEDKQYSKQKQPYDAIDLTDSVLEQARDALEPPRITFSKSGTDPSKEVKVVKAILRREQALQMLRKSSGRAQFNPQRISSLMERYREATIDTVEAVVDWSEANSEPFMWHGKNYLLSVPADLDALWHSKNIRSFLNFDINNYPKFKNKIIYLVIDREPNDLIEIEQNNVHKRLNSIKRIELSYNYMNNAIKDVAEDDLIILSDNDEIPNLDSKAFLNCKKNIILFKQLFFYYKFNLFYDLMPWFGSKACKKKSLKSFSWLNNLKGKKYPFWRLDTFFTQNKLINLEIINDGGWHFTNLKSPRDLYEKFNNFGHHDEFIDSGITIEKLKYYIDNGIVFYNHFADQKDQNKWNYNYKLKKINNEFLPKYLVDNKDKYKNWFS